MAKQTLPTNYKDDILNSSMGGKRRYNLTQNTDGTYSLEDVSTYDQVGSNFGAGQINATNTAVNASFDAGKIIRNLSDIAATTASGYVPDALALKEVYNDSTNSTKKITWSYLTSSTTLNTLKGALDAGYIRFTTDGTVVPSYGRGLLITASTSGFVLLLCDDDKDDLWLWRASGEDASAKVYEVASKKKLGSSVIKNIKLALYNDNDDDAAAHITLDATNCSTLAVNYTLNDNSRFKVWGNAVDGTLLLDTGIGTVGTFTKTVNVSAYNTIVMDMFGNGIGKDNTSMVVLNSFELS